MPLPFRRPKQSTTLHEVAAASVLPGSRGGGANLLLARLLRVGRSRVLDRAAEYASNVRAFSLSHHLSTKQSHSARSSAQDALAFFKSVTARCSSTHLAPTATAKAAISGKVVGCALQRTRLRSSITLITVTLMYKARSPDPTGTTKAWAAQLQRTSQPPRSLWYDVVVILPRNVTKAWYPYLQDDKNGDGLLPDATITREDSDPCLFLLNVASEHIVAFFYLQKWQGCGRLIAGGHDHNRGL